MSQTVPSVPVVSPALNPSPLNALSPSLQPLLTSPRPCTFPQFSRHFILKLSTDALGISLLSPSPASPTHLHNCSHFPHRSCTYLSHSSLAAHSLISHPPYILLNFLCSLVRSLIMLLCALCLGLASIYMCILYICDTFVLPRNSVNLCSLGFDIKLTELSLPASMLRIWALCPCSPLHISCDT